MSKDRIEIKDIDENILGDLECVCLPEEKINDPLFIEGDLMWRKWVRENLKRYDTIGKIACSPEEIVGFIQYVPKPEKKLVEIKCTFEKKGQDDYPIKETLLKETILEFKEPKPYFRGDTANALVTFPEHVLQNVAEEKFYMANGFKQANSNPYLLYYPLKEGYTYVSEPRNILIDEMDRDKALIFCNTSSPYCVKEMMDALETLRDMDKDIPIKIVIPYEEPKKLAHVFSMPLCMVINEKVIEYSLLDDEEFLEKMKIALNREDSVAEDKRRYHHFPTSFSTA
ncbi:MAG: hypothetical protein ACLFVL_00465 [Candidatus Aenigmatarchaeota archaeon]